MRIQIAKHDELVNKYVRIEKERVKIKKSVKSMMSVDKEIIDSLKKEKDNLRKKIRRWQKEELINWNWY